MKQNLFLFVISFFVNFPGISQSYTWALTDTTYYSGRDVITSEVIDHSGNLIVACAPYDEHYRAYYIDIIKFDASHTRLWTKRINSQATAGLNIGLCVDSYNNILITSDYSGILKYDGVLYVNHGGGNMFLIKVDSAGNFLWEKHTTGSHCWGRKVSCDGQDNIYIAGNISAYAYFDSVYVNTPYVVYNYIAKYTGSGQFLWVKNGSGNSQSGYGLGLKTDKTGNSYLSGVFSHNIYFDSLFLQTFGSSGYRDAYLAKIDSSGKWLWAINTGGIGWDGFYNIDLDTTGNIYMMGFFGSPTATFGSTTLTNASNDDFYLAKYDSSGNNIWAVRGWKNGFSESFCVDKDGNAYLKSNNKFIYKYDSNGNYSWSASASAWNSAMIADDSGNVYVCGTFTDSVSFGNYHLVGKYPGYLQVFVAKIEFPASIINVNEMLKADLFNAYPNPAISYVTVSCMMNEKQNGVTLRVVNSSGTIVHLESINGTSSFTRQLNVENLAPGIYFIELSSNDGKTGQAKKIIVQ
ncbi:MAG: T9SS type A sorting domain-containing protein [Bacteroidia bacterium]